MTARAITLIDIAIISASRNVSMAKARSRKVHDLSSTLYFRFKRAFDTKTEAKHFAAELEKYVRKASREIAGKGVKFVVSEPGVFTVARKENHMNIRLRRNLVAVNINGKTGPNDMKALDQLLNRLIGFLEISKQSVQRVTSVTSIDFRFNENPVDTFYDKPAIADLASKSRMQFKPIGVALQIKSPDSSLLCMFSYSAEKERTTMTISQYIRHLKQPWDILSQNNDRILSTKDQILAALGAKEQ